MRHFKPSEIAEIKDIAKEVFLEEAKKQKKPEQASHEKTSAIGNVKDKKPSLIN